MARPLAALLGIANLIPIAYVAYFFWYLTSLQPGVEPRLDRLYGLHLAMMVGVLILTIVYLIIAYRSQAVPNGRRIFWAGALLIWNVLVFPVFWYLYVWRRPSLHQ